MIATERIPAQVLLDVLEALETNDVSIAARMV
jgi:hypothetical protein